mgnify:CR=1 FL=1
MAEEKKGLFSHVDEHGRIDLKKMEEIAEKDRQEREGIRRKVWQAKEERARKRTDAINDLLKKTGDQTAADNEAEAQRRIKEAKEKTDREIEERIRKETGTRKEANLDRAYKSLLEGNKQKLKIDLKKVQEDLRNDEKT